MSAADYSAKSIEELRALAMGTAFQPPDVFAQFHLGERLYFGKGCPQDESEAASWLRVSADSGNADAQDLLGAAYFEGRGVVRDDREACRLYRLAVDQNHTNAQAHLGYMYANGFGVPCDDSEAVRWLRLAAVRRNHFAEYLLGLMYRDGRGTSKDEHAAAYWVRRAAARGNDWARKELGDMYRFGQGMPRDLDEAARWYRRAAANGDAEALARLEDMGYAAQAETSATQGSRRPENSPNEPQPAKQVGNALDDGSRNNKPLGRPQVFMSRLWYAIAVALFLLGSLYVVKGVDSRSSAATYFVTYGGVFENWQEAQKEIDRRWDEAKRKNDEKELSEITRRQLEDKFWDEARESIQRGHSATIQAGEHLAIAQILLSTSLLTVLKARLGTWLSLRRRD